MRTLRASLLFIFCCALLAVITPAQTTSCASDDGKRHTCNMDTSQGVVLLKQRSGSDCTRGYSWGYENGSVWVDKGCRADFGPGQGGQTILCESDDGKRHYCEAQTGGGATLVKQRSETRCQEGVTWGYDNRGVWVDKGCRGEFTAMAGSFGNAGQLQTVTCSSDDGKRHNCLPGPISDARISRQISGSACERGRSWGFDNQGLWVDKGCRAEFAVLTGSNSGGYMNNGNSCRREIGEEQARMLVDKCMQVSPGTHPPCNAENSCRTIADEIRRSCSLLGGDRPMWCDQFRNVDPR